MSETAGQSATQTRGPRLLSWIVLVAILLGYTVCVVCLHPSNFFGLSEDDSLYFSSAKAIAGGRATFFRAFLGSHPGPNIRSSIHGYYRGCGGGIRRFRRTFLWL